MTEPARTLQETEKPGPALRLGHPGRARRGTLQVSLLLTVLFVVFFLMAFHDEIVLEAAQNGWLPRGRVEFYELLVCGGLFLVWSAAILRLIRVLGDIGKSGGHRK